MLQREIAASLEERLGRDREELCGDLCALRVEQGRLPGIGRAP